MKSLLVGLLTLLLVAASPPLAQGNPATTAASADEPSAGANTSSSELGAAQASGGSSASNASNYGGGAHFSVNPRTGGVSLQVPMFRLPGIRAAASAALTLNYQSEDAISDYESSQGNGPSPTVFGLPPGWSMNLSYMQPRSVNGRSYVSVNIDGSQSYIFDPDWETVNPATETVVKIGLQQYNKTDVNFTQLENSDIVVNNLEAAYQYANLNGTTRYLSVEGLMLQESDRFGNTIQYYYQCGVDPSSARLDYIVDSWKNRIDFSYPNGKPCDPIQGQVTITLPDGRTVGYVIEDQITQVIDAQGKITHFDWRNLNNTPEACSEYPLPSGITAPTGMVSTVYYQCMNICTATTSPNACSATAQVKQWPVAFQLFECPSGAQPCGSGDAGAMWTTYALGGTQSSSGLADPDNNYTGFPYFSPLTPNPSYPGSDPLMAAQGTQKFGFEYQTLMTRLSQGIETYQSSSTYTFLHLLKESEVKVRAKMPNGFFGLVTSKQVSHCYNLPGSAAAGCPLNSEQINYESLPANYQTPTTSGSCIYSVGGVGTSGGRISITTQSYDIFGRMINHRRYHGTTGEGVITNCTRETRLDPSPLKLVLDDYREFDMPTQLSDGYYVLGPQATSFGLMIATLSFAYLDDDPGNFHGALGDTVGPIRVTLSCGKLVGSGSTIPPGAAIKSNTYGSLPTTTSAPTTPGKIPACANPAWDLSTAPPKLETFSYDSSGRMEEQVLTWATVKEPGITSTSDTLAYTKTTPQSYESACSQATAGQNTAPVLQSTKTDADGNVSVSRVCTLNHFLLSTKDPSGHLTLYEYDPTGLATRVTAANGTSQTYDYFYNCPEAPGGATCPSTVKACPYDTASEARNCVVRTVHSGQSESFADGVAQATIKDGMGRVSEVRDNLGAADGAYSTWQTRLTKDYDNLGLVTQNTDLIGVSNPLSYATTFTYGAKLRPILVCDPHGIAHEAVHDDVAQKVKKLLNGHQRELTLFNDSHRVVQLGDCPAGEDTTAKGAGACPTVASEVTEATCAGNVYDTSLLLDGVGAQHSVTAGSANAQAIGASVASVTGQATLSAELIKYGFSIQTTPVDTDSGASGTAHWSRDLQGMSLGQEVSVTTALSPKADTFESDAFAYNEIAEQVSETNKLSKDLVDSYTYTPTGLMCTRKDYAGTVFTHFYDSADRMVRYCYDSMICVGGTNNGGACAAAADCPGGSCQAGSAGENFTLDPLTGKVLTVTHFTNPEACGACTATPPTEKDIAGNLVAMTYTKFGSTASKTYTETIDGKTVTSKLQWAYDAYQRPTCFADVMATANGSTCPASPAAADWWKTNTAPYLTWYVYYPQSDAYRRGLLNSVCRRDGAGAVNCVDKDYYTSASTGGGCASQFSQAADLTGAFAGLLSDEKVCSGGSCTSNEGTALTTIEYEYDAHRRVCSVQTCQGEGGCQAGGGELILGSTYAHDQYNNVIQEIHQSDVDASNSSNYQVSYVYDGLMRLLSSTRTDLDDNPLETISYRYDAASNIVKKVQTVVVE